MKTLSAMVALVLLLVGCGIDVTPMVEPQAPKPFDALDYIGQPADIGLDRSMLFFSGNMAYVKRLPQLGSPQDIWNSPDILERLTREAWAAGYTSMVMDDEDYNLPRLARNIAVIRAAAPGMKVGVFCIPQTYYNWSAEYTRGVNDRAEVAAILKSLDFAVPGIDDCRWDLSKPEGRDAWSAFLKLAVAECERAMPGKPCYPFLTPYYEPSVTAREVTAEEFAWQLRQVRATGKKPIIWGGWAQPWDSARPWYQGWRMVDGAK